MSDSSDRKVTLVCGGGGVWGIAWMTGLAKGLADLGVDLHAADHYIGTSAGSVLCTQLASGLDVDHLFERQTEPHKQTYEITPDENALARLVSLARQPFGSEQERVEAMCNLALEVETVSVPERSAIIVERLGIPEDAWPSKRLSITAIDIETTELVAFDSSYGIPLSDAVAASCSVPGVWPAVPFNGKYYTDGGISGSADNAGLATGAKNVVLFSPIGHTINNAFGENPHSINEVAHLRKEGTSIAVISPDKESLETMALGMLNPQSRIPAAIAGQEQARAVLEKIEPLWMS